MRIKEFAKATGQAALEGVGVVTGKIGGIVMNGVDGFKAIEALLKGDVNTAQELALKSQGFEIEKLEKIDRKPFVNNDPGFNPSITGAFARGVSNGYEEKRKTEMLNIGPYAKADAKLAKLKKGM